MADLAEVAGGQLGPAQLARVAHLIERTGVEVRGSLRSSVLAGGRSNVTLRLDDDASSWVMRMPPSAGRTPSAHDVAREFRAVEALARTAVPVPSAVLLCEDDDAVGRPFAVCGFVPGKTVQSRADLEALSDATVEATMTQLIEVLVSLHEVDHVAVGLDRFGRPDGYAERQLARWSSQWEIVGTPEHEHLAAALIAMLGDRLPRQSSVGIVHGDYRIDNALLDLSGSPRVAAVVDWELATIGDPLADVAMMAVYRHPAFDLVLGSPCAWTSDRLAEPDQIAASYARLSGRSLVDWEAHLALGCLKIAVIAAGIEHRRALGATSGLDVATAGRAVPEFLRAGLEQLGG